MTTPATTPDSIWRLIGLARRAGKMVFGSEAVERSARSGKIQLLILSGDAGPNTTGRLEQVSRVTQIPILVVSDRDSLGRWTGKSQRVVAGLTDQGFADRLQALAANETEIK
ncbi:MAG: L7Ae/L30e/S12e/Gadd45 family ribosomal protein [Eubacteriales bacterium]|nr:L7Ae/L30e/S12e/Gadd45 family ribosomal protein [Eubacteriales bacterium]